MLKFVAFALIVAATPVAAQITFDDGPVKPTAQSQDLTKIVCKKQESLGSRLGAKKVCLTAREWKEQEELTRAAVERMQQNTGVPPSN